MERYASCLLLLLIIIVGVNGAPRERNRPKFHMRHRYMGNDAGSPRNEEVKTGELSDNDAGSRKNDPASFGPRSCKFPLYDGGKYCRGPECCNSTVSSLSCGLLFLNHFIGL